MVTVFYGRMIISGDDLMKRLGTTDVTLKLRLRFISRNRLETRNEISQL